MVFHLTGLAFSVAPFLLKLAYSFRRRMGIVILQHCRAAKLKDKRNKLQFFDDRRMQISDGKKYTDAQNFNLGPRFTVDYLFRPQIAFSTDCVRFIWTVIKTRLSRYIVAEVDNVAYLTTTYTYSLL